MKVKEEHFEIMPKGIYMDSRLNTTAQSILAQLFIRSMGKDVVAQVNTRVFSKTCGVSRPTFDKAITLLEETGWVTVERGGKVGDKCSTNTYTLHRDNTIEVDEDSLYWQDIERHIDTPLEDVEMVINHKEKVNGDCVECVFKSVEPVQEPVQPETPKRKPRTLAKDLYQQAHKTESTTTQPEKPVPTRGFPKKTREQARRELDTPTTTARRTLKRSEPVEQHAQYSDYNVQIGIKI